MKNIENDVNGQRLRPCGPLELSTRGFVSPYGRDEEELVHRVGDYRLLAIGGEDKLLPAAVVREAVAVKLAEITQKEHRKISAKERKDLKENVISELLPRAFVRPSRLFAYADLARGWWAVDTSSRKAAEETVSQVREALGRFPAIPASAGESSRALMTQWLIRGKLPSGLVLGDECELRDPAEAGAIVRCRRQALESDEVREHLKSGKQVFQLGLQFDDRISFVLSEDMTIRKLRFLDVVLEELDEEDVDSARAELEARFALMTLEFARLLEQLEGWFDMTRPTDRDK